MKHIHFIIVLFAQIFGVIGVKAAFSAVVTPYGDAQKMGVFEDQIQIEYDKEIFFNKRQYAKLLSIVDNPKIPNIMCNSYIYRGFDQKVVKTMIALNGDFTTGTVAGASADLTLVQDDKYHITVNQILKLAYTPDTGFTNEVWVSDRKDSDDRVTITVKPCDATLKIGKSTGYTGYHTNYPTVNCLGSWFDDNSKSVKPASTNPELIYNYMQLQRTFYEYGKQAAKQNLYTRGTLKAMKDSIAKNLHLKLMQKTMIFGGQRYQKLITVPTETTEYRKMYGLEDWILANGTANKSYTKTISTGLVDEFNEWLWLMADPAQEPMGYNRLGICNQAAIKWISDMKQAQVGIDFAPAKEWGIEGVQKLRWGQMTLDLMVEDAINEVYSAQDEPYIMALTPPFIKIAKMEPTTLEANIQDNDQHGYKSGYYTGWTFLLHNSATSAHAIFRKAS